MNRKILALLSLIITISLTYALNNKIGKVPPIGKFLSPYQGFWKNAEDQSRFSLLENLKIDGLIDEVTVKLDENRVPHIFAKNNHDLYLAQGYVIASDRLWQMEFSTRSAAGRLAEVLGGGLPAESDRLHRKIGMVYNAEKSLAFMYKNPETKLALESYAKGVNEYISQLKPSEYPFEYKLLDYAPEKWNPIQTVLMVKEMAFAMSARLGTGELEMNNVKNLIGKEDLNELFPNYPYIESPIIPSSKKWNFKAEPIKLSKIQEDKNQSLLFSKVKNYKKDIYNNLISSDLTGIGSNNWAVHGSHTSTGLPVLSGDPHLKSTMPHTLYQIQLHAPEVNVYGSSIPGTPGVILGFNKNIAWMGTNVGSDVADWYNIKFKDKSRKEYFYNGKWVKTINRIEIIKVKGKEPIVDTVTYTHHGPVVYNKSETPLIVNYPVGYALRWTANETTDEFITYHKLNRAKNYKDFTKAIEKQNYPAINFAFASNENIISLWVNGKFPIKRKEQGKHLSDGSSPNDDWHGWIPHEQKPHIENPERGFVSSANQFSTDPTYPYYLASRFLAANRGRLINEKLTNLVSSKKVDLSDMQKLQNDFLNVDARDFVPVLLKQIKLNELDSSQKQAFNKLSKWDYKNLGNYIEPSIYELWTSFIIKNVWEDELTDGKKLSILHPTLYTTMKFVIEKPNSKWFNNIKTANKTENSSDIITQSFKKTVDSLTQANGEMSDEWRWGKIKELNIAHLLPPMKALSRKIQIGGGSNIINAIAKDLGPAFKLVVQLSKEWPEAYGIYPGGQSGNPGSIFYDNMLKKYAKGELNKILFLKSKEEESPLLKKTVLMQPK